MTYCIQYPIPSSQLAGNITELQKVYGINCIVSVKKVHDNYYIYYDADIPPDYMEKHQKIHGVRVDQAEVAKALGFSTVEEFLLWREEAQQLEEKERMRLNDSKIIPNQ